MSTGDGSPRGRGSPQKATVVIVGGGFAGVGCAQAPGQARGRARSWSTRTTTTSSSRSCTRWRPISSPRPTSPDRCAGSSARTPRSTSSSARWSASIRQPEDGDHEGWHHLSGRLPGPGRRHPAQLLPHARRRSSTLSPLQPGRTPSGCGRVSSRCSRTPTAIPTLVDQGALNFVVIGAGATGVETAGAIARPGERRRCRERYHGLSVARRPDPSSSTSAMSCSPPSPKGCTSTPPRSWSARACDSTSACRPRRWREDKVMLSDGTAIETRTVVWAGGLLASPWPPPPRLPQGRGGRVDGRGRPDRRRPSWCLRAR